MSPLVSGPKSGRKDGQPPKGRPRGRNGGRKQMSPDDPLVTFGGTIHQSQAEYLRSLPNASQALREAVALHREKFEPTETPRI